MRILYFLGKTLPYLFLLSKFYFFAKYGGIKFIFYAAKNSITLYVTIKTKILQLIFMNICFLVGTFVFFALSHTVSNGMSEKNSFAAQIDL